MKILLAEDTKDLNRAVTVLLEHEGYSVDSAFDGEDAYEKVLSNGYDALILDIMMPKKDGIEVLKDIRDKGINVPVMMLTAKAEIDDKVLGLDSGADDYLTKPFAMKELLARVRALVRRKKDYDSEHYEFKDLRLSGNNFELVSENSIILSVKEYELLKLMLCNLEQKLSTQYILEQVWKDDEDADEQTVKLYIMYIKGKLRGVASDVKIAGDESGYYLI